MRWLPLVVLVCGCLPLMGDEARTAFFGIKLALERKDNETATILAETGVEFAGEPADREQVPESPGEARQWRKTVLAKYRRIRFGLASLLGKLGLPALGGGTGIMAVLAGLFFKHKRALTEAAGNLGAALKNKGATGTEIRKLQGNAEGILETDFKARKDELEAKAKNGIPAP